MTFLAQPTLYDQAGFQHLVAGLSWSKGWRPAFPTLHNTGVPTLATYLGYGKSVHDRWGQNLNHYYRGMGWHSGPHVVCCPDGILVLCDPEQDGISVSCWNHVTFGIEMVGDFDREDFASGPGAQVRDNAVHVLAVLANKLGWALDPLVTGKSGLHFHRMCTQDHHACPGKNVVRSDVLARVEARRAELSGSAIVVHAAPPAPAHDVAWAQATLNEVDDAGLDVDNDLGKLTERALKHWQITHGLVGTGALSAMTIASLEKAAAELNAKG